MDYFSDDMNQNEISKNPLKTISELKAYITKNKCNKPKDIGDKVIVWDGSWSEDIKSGENYFGTDEIFEYPLIIIEQNCKNIMFNKELKTEKNRDIVVYSPKHNRKIATCMDCVRLIEDKNIDYNTKVQ